MTTATPFKHVIVIMQENHTFDNYFGTYPTANGTLLNNITANLARVNGIPAGVCLPTNGGCISPHLTTSSSPDNPVEGQTVYENDYRPGSNFVTSSGPQSMVYFDYHSIPGYWDLAEEYGLADNYFAAVLSMTTPNRLIVMSGDTSVSANYGPPPYLLYNQTVMGQLDAAGISWGYYDVLNSSINPTATYPLNYVDGLAGSRASIRNVSSIFSELKSGTGLPSVSYVNFFGDLGLSEHPPFSPTVGEAQVVGLMDAVMGSNYWNSTVVFITWDEGGGFYDHVEPPRSFTLDHGFGKELQGLGQRVPLLVISPYGKVNYVSHVLLSHLSLLHFIEYNWNLPPLDGLVAGSILPVDFFDFSMSPRAPISLGAGTNSQVSYPLPLEKLAPEHNLNLPAFPGSQIAPIAISVMVMVIVVGTAYFRQRSRLEQTSGAVHRHR